MLTEAQRYELTQLERIAAKHEFIAVHLKHAVNDCRQRETLEGIDEMVAFAFNALAHSPSYGSGGSSLPPGVYKGVIVDIRKETNKAGNGGFFAFDLTPIEGPYAQQKHTDRLNIHNLNAETVRIANEQLSAYCHVVGQYNIADTAQLLNIPFFFEIGFQKGQEPGTEKGGENGGFTEVKKLKDINGNEPGKQQPGGAVATAPVAPAAAPPAQVQPTAAAPTGWGGAPAETAAVAPAVAPAAVAPAVAPATAPAAAWGGPVAAVAPAAAPVAGASALPPGW